MFYKSSFASGVLTQKYNHRFCIKITICLQKAQFHSDRAREPFKNRSCWSEAEKKGRWLTTITFKLLTHPVIQTNKVCRFDQWVVMILSLLTSKGDAKSLKRYATSRGLSFFMYNLFKPSIIDVTRHWGAWLSSKWKMIKLRNCKELKHASTSRIVTEIHKI